MDYGFRNYDSQIGRWHSPDPVSHWAENLSPYRYGLNNPVRYIDLLGLWEATAGGYKTDKKEDIERFMVYLQAESAVSKNKSPDFKQMGSFIKGEMSGGRGKLSDGSPLLTGVSVTGYRNGNNTRFYADQNTVDRTWHEVQGNLTPDVLDPRTLNGNLLWTTYAGGDNPKTYSGNDDYSYIPKNPIEHPAIAHDRAYDKLGINGLTGLLTSTSAIGADYEFVARELLLSNNPNLDLISRAKARTLGLGLGALAAPKTGYYFINQSIQSLKLLQAHPGL